jgi:hypothetical protein
MTRADRSNGRLAATLTLCAAATGAAQTLWAAATFGDWLAYAIYAQPIVVSAVLFVVLRAYCTTGRRPFVWLAATIAGLFAVWGFVGGFSLGAGAWPAAWLLVAAVAVAPRGQVGPERSVSCSASRLV